MCWCWGKFKSESGRQRPGPVGRNNSLLAPKAAMLFKLSVQAESRGNEYSDTAGSARPVPTHEAQGREVVADAVLDAAALRERDRTQRLERERERAVGERAQRELRGADRPVRGGRRLPRVRRHRPRGVRRDRWDLRRNLGQRLAAAARGAGALAHDPLVRREERVLRARAAADGAGLVFEHRLGRVCQAAALLDLLFRVVVAGNATLGDVTEAQDAVGVGEQRVGRALAHRRQAGGVVGEERRGARARDPRAVEVRARRCGCKGAEGRGVRLVRAAARRHWAADAEVSNPGYTSPLLGVTPATCRLLSPAS